MKKLSLLPLLIFCLQAFAQNEDAVKYASVITGDNLKKYLTVIAGDEMQGYIFSAAKPADEIRRHFLPRSDELASEAKTVAA